MADLGARASAHDIVSFRHPFRGPSLPCRIRHSPNTHGCGQSPGFFVFFFFFSWQSPTFEIVFDNGPRAGYRWFFRARAYHLKGPILVGWLGIRSRPEVHYYLSAHLSACPYPHHQHQATAIISLPTTILLPLTNITAASTIYSSHIYIVISHHYGGAARYRVL